MRTKLENRTSGDKMSEGLVERILEFRGKGFGWFMGSV